MIFDHHILHALGFTESLRLELQPFGIKMVSISPGDFRIEALTVSLFFLSVHPVTSCRFSQCVCTGEVHPSRREPYFGVRPYCWPIFGVPKKISGNQPSDPNKGSICHMLSSCPILT